MYVLTSNIYSCEMLIGIAYYTSWVRVLFLHFATLDFLHQFQTAMFKMSLLIHCITDVSPK